MGLLHLAASNWEHLVCTVLELYTCKGVLLVVLNWISCRLHSVHAHGSHGTSATTRFESWHGPFGSAKGTAIVHCSSTRRQTMVVEPDHCPQSGTQRPKSFEIPARSLAGSQHLTIEIRVEIRVCAASAASGPSCASSSHLPHTSGRTGIPPHWRSRS